MMAHRWRHVREALNRLHRNKWFWMGFTANRPPWFDETAGQHLAAEENLDPVTEWLAGVLDGKFRTLAPGRLEEIDGRGVKTVTERHDEGLFAISFAEIEAIMDGLRNGATEADRYYALHRIKPLIDAIEREREFYRAEVEAPF
jgi:hypothetical protein